MVESFDRSGRYCSELPTRFLFDFRFPELYRPGTFVAGCSAVHLNWALRPSIHACSSCSIMDVFYFCVIPRVALWSHSAAEPLLLRLAVAGILMGGLRFLFLGSSVRHGRCSALGLLRPLTSVFCAPRRRRGCLHSFWFRGARCESWLALQRWLSQFLQRNLAILTHPPRLFGQ